MADFSTIIDEVFDVEGGFQNHEDDRGNYVCANLKFVKGKSDNYYCEDKSQPTLVGTNRGISAPIFANHIGKIPTIAELKAMSAETAREILEVKYWMRMKGDTIVSQEVAHIYFDGVVNHGIYLATELMQEVCNDLGSNLTVDSIVGPATIAAVNSHPEAILYNAYKQRRISKYHNIVANDPGQQSQVDGWLNRINTFADLIEDDSEPSAPQPVSTTTQVNIVFDEIALSANEVAVKHLPISYSKSNVLKMKIVLVVVAVIFVAAMTTGIVQIVKR